MESIDEPLAEMIPRKATAEEEKKIKWNSEYSFARSLAARPPDGSFDRAFGGLWSHDQHEIRLPSVASTSDGAESERESTKMRPARTPSAAFALFY